MGAGDSNPASLHKAPAVGPVVGMAIIGLARRAAVPCALRMGTESVSDGLAGRCACPARSN